MTTSKMDGAGLCYEPLLETALRVSEFVGLQIEDISFVDRLITIQGGKGGRRRAVPITQPITQSLARELRIYIRDRNTGPLFASPRGLGYSTRRIQQIVKEVAQSADIEKRGYFHPLCHQSTDTTQIYVEIASRLFRSNPLAVRFYSLQLVCGPGFW